MIDTFRPLLFPLTVCTIVGCVWAVGWNKSIEDQAGRVTRPSTLSRYTADAGEENFDSAPHGCQATAEVDHE
jgi:hypothetical protein